MCHRELRNFEGVFLVAELCSHTVHPIQRENERVNLWKLITNPGRLTRLAAADERKPANRERAQE